MPSYFANPFADRSAAILPIVEVNRQNDRRRLSVASMDEALDWHETFMFGPGEEPPRLRRASSFGDVSEYANNMAAIRDQNEVDLETQSVQPSRPDAFRYRSPSVVDARQNGLGRTKLRQGSVVQNRRPSLAGRRPSIVDRRGSTSVSEDRTRQPSVAWARQSSVIDRQLANMTWSRAERLMSLDDQFYQNASTAITGQNPLLTEKIKRLDEKQTHIAVEEVSYPSITDPKDPAKVLGKSNLRNQKMLFMLFIFALNAGCLTGAIFGGGPAGTFVFVFILFTKSKDVCSVVLTMLWMPLHALYRKIRPLPPVKGHWILTLIPAYSESEETIVKAIRGLRDNNVAPHEQVMVVILDGKPRDVKAHMRIIKSFRRPYVTFKWKRGELLIDAGFVDDVPVIVFEKVKNAGKKDSLILAFDLFNALRDNAPLYTKLLREEIWRKILPVLTAGKSIPFEKFDMMFCTDADSTIYEGALLGLANALIRDPKAIAACGSVLVDTQPGTHYSFWNLYQQFQYSFGQYVRRRAEGIWGKVTCLPGCITMIRVRDEMKGAVTKYAEPITKTPVIHHQVQYLGTDRRLTYCMLSQSSKLHTLFVPNAVSLTEAPQSLKHYLSQRRRWGSNSYFNDWFYCFGENMILVTRLEALIEITRLSLVYYRIANTIMFFYGLTTRSFGVMQLVPLLVVSQLPTVWFFVNVIFVKELRRRAHKIIIGFLINHLVSPFMSMTIFFNVLRNLGSQVWGMTGGNSATTVVNAVAVTVMTDPPTSTTVSTESSVAGTMKDISKVRVQTYQGSFPGSNDSKVPLATVIKIDEAGHQVGPLSAHPAFALSKSPIPPKMPLGLNATFSFGKTNMNENPFQDPPHPVMAIEQSKFHNFGGFGGFDVGSNTLEVNSGRRRSSAAGPLDKRRTSSVSSPLHQQVKALTIPAKHLPVTPSNTMLPRRRQTSFAIVSMVEEEQEPDSPTHRPSVPSSFSSLRTGRTSSSASKASREKGSIASIPIFETEEQIDEASDQPSDLLRVSSNRLDQATAAIALVGTNRDDSSALIGRNAPLTTVTFNQIPFIKQQAEIMSGNLNTTSSLPHENSVLTSVKPSTTPTTSFKAPRTMKSPIFPRKVHWFDNSIHPANRHVTETSTRPTTKSIVSPTWRHFSLPYSKRASTCDEVVPDNHIDEQIAETPILLLPAPMAESPDPAPELSSSLFARRASLPNLRTVVADRKGLSISTATESDLVAPLSATLHGVAESPLTRRKNAGWSICADLDSMEADLGSLQMAWEMI